MSNPIIVTGSAGFIGFHLTQRLLARGEQVIGIDNLNDYYDKQLKVDRNAILLQHPGYRFIELDIATEDINKALGNTPIKALCHLAAQAGVRYSLTHPLVYEAANVKGFLHILELAKQRKIEKLIYASSSSVYGNVPMPAEGFHEELAVNQPISLYAATKLADELMAYTYHHLYGLTTIGLRFFTVYGPWGRPDMFYFSCTKSLYEHTPIELYNQGEMWRDFTYVDDIVSGIEAALDTATGYAIYNLGNSQPTHLKKFVSILEELTQQSAELILKPLQPGELVSTFANTTKAERDLNFQPQTQVEQGLAAFVQWYKSYYAK